MRRKERGLLIEERAVRPFRTAVVTAIFTLINTILVFLLLLSAMRAEVEQEIDFVGEYLAAHMADAGLRLINLPPMGEILAMKSVEIPLPSGDRMACNKVLADWFRQNFPQGDQSGVDAFVRPTCQGKEVQIGHGRVFGVMDVLMRRAAPTGEILVDAVTVQRSTMNFVELIKSDVRLPMLAVLISLTAAVFAYFLRRQPYLLYLAAKQRAAMDGLSGVLRREQFLEGLDKAVTAARVSGHATSLLAVDIDSFKQINDRFGHAAGDEVIRICGNLITSTVRGGDLVGRTGGEEFMVLLPDLPKFIAAEVADRLRKRIKSHGFTFGDETYFATVSIGVASLMQADTLGTLSERADRRLYKAKRDGRNRVVWEDDSDFDY